MSAEDKKFSQWFMGNESAIEMARLVAEASQVADDIVDEDIDKHEGMARLLSIAFVELPYNQFYSLYKDKLSPIFATSIQIWSMSDKWRENEDKTIKMFGFVYREILEQTIVMVAYILGGQKHARKVADEMIEYYRSTDQDSFDEWVKEVDNG